MSSRSVGGKINKGRKALNKVGKGDWSPVHNNLSKLV